MDTGLVEALFKQIGEFQPFNEQEANDQQRILDYANRCSNLFERSNEEVHFTSSPWIVNKTRDKVLMVYHHIYQSWSWTGGHCDGNPDTLYVALKEGKEETGLVNLRALYTDIFAIDVLSVPTHIKHGKQVPQHIHINLTYLCEADESEKLKNKPDENSDVAWIELAKIDECVKEQQMLPLYHKLIEKTRI